MTDPVRDAAQALVDRIDRGRKEYQEAWPDDDAELDALRRALAYPAPSTSTADMKPLCARCGHDYGQHEPIKGTKDWSCEECDCDAFYWPAEAPSTSTAALRTHRCINDGGDGYECPGCHANGFLSPTPAPSTSRDAARDEALEEAAREVEDNVDVVESGRGYLRGDDGRETLRAAVKAIRSLKGQPSPTPDPSTKEQP